MKLDLRTLNHKIDKELQNCFEDSH